MSRTRGACIYCGVPATTRDHVPPKLLLVRPLPSTLLTVPSCLECNRGRSEDEEYLRALIAQVGVSQSLSQMVEDGGVVDRSLLRSRRLAARIDDASEVTLDGRVAIVPEPAPIERVLRKVAHGLFVGRYRRNPGPTCFRSLGLYPYSIEDQRPAFLFASVFDTRFRPKSWVTVQPHVFSYTFVRHPFEAARMLCVMDFHRDLWGAVVTPAARSGRLPAARGQPTLF